MVVNVLVAARPKVPQCKETSTNKANMLLSVPINCTSARIAREGNARGRGSDSS